MTEDETRLSPERLRQLLEEKFKNLKELEISGKNSIYIKELSDIALIQLQLQLYNDSEQNYLICLKHFEKQKDRLGQAAVHGVRDPAVGDLSSGEGGSPGPVQGV